MIRNIMTVLITVFNYYNFKSWFYWHCYNWITFTCWFKWQVSRICKHDLPYV